MTKVHVEEKNRITCRYLNAQDGMRVYLLPNVPKDAGQILPQEDLDDSTINEYMGKQKFTPDQRERARRIVSNYRGKQVCTLSILGYAQEQDRFDEFAKRLEDKRKDFMYIPPPLMAARTDVTAFFIRLYADLGKAPEEHAREAEELVEKYGPGVVVLPKK